jgi:hypothetical protein
MPRRGPNTREGKLISSRNAVRHGIHSSLAVIPGLESAREYDEHRARILAALDPSDAIEEFHTERVISASWRLRRLQRYETECIVSAIDRVPAEQRTRLQMLEVLRGTAEQRVLTHIDRAADFLNRLPELLDDAPCDVPGIHLVLELAGCPDPEGTPIPTAGSLRAALHKQARVRNHDPDAFVAELASAIAAAAVEVRCSPEELERQRQSMRVLRLLPGNAELDRIVRYEAHLQRIVDRSLLAIEISKARLHGERVPVGRLDLNVSSR